MNTRIGMDRDNARQLRERERARFVERMPTSQQFSGRAAQHLRFDVPLHWMNDWPTPFSLYVSEARGEHYRDVDRHVYARRDRMNPDVNVNMSGFGPAKPAQLPNCPFNHR